MKKTDTNKIDALASRAIADLIDERAKSADTRNVRTVPDAPTLDPVPEYRLAFRVDEEKNTVLENAVPENGPEIFPFVAAALALFMLVPALVGNSRPTIGESFASALDSGELTVFTNEFKDTMIRVSQTLQH